MALEIPTATFYRWLKPSSKTAGTRRPSFRALSEEERKRILCVLHEDRFVDRAPSEIYAALLDEGAYLCSIRTMYRILHEHGEVKERRNLRRHPQYKTPELLATAPKQVWSYDITKLKGPEKWTYYYLYVVMDIFSRHVVGWTVARHESSRLAKTLIRQSCRRQAVNTTRLTIHSDRGAPMTSKTVALLMSDLGIVKSHSRPHVSNDNPFSESHFKTIKYRPEFPRRFGSLEDARAFCQKLFDWYNNEHYHSGIALMTPFTVHYGHAKVCNQKRQAVLTKAFQQHPERFVSGPPETLQLPDKVWINPPNKDATVCDITIYQQSEAELPVI